MSHPLQYIHHVGHVVHDMSKALELYRKLGFSCPPPTYPMIAPVPGALPAPFGAANTHVTFARNFIELATVVSVGTPIPNDAVMVPLQVPDAVLPRVLDSITRTVGTLAAGLARFEGLHILVLQTDDVAATAVQFDQDGVGHSGVNVLQRPIETTAGQHVVPIRVLEIDQEPVPEGRLAVADTPPPDVLRMQSHMNHPNGAVDLVESILCVSDNEIDAYVQRYRRYLGRDARSEDGTQIFDLQDSRITIVPASRFGALLPGEVPPALPAFVAYAVAVHDLHVVEALLSSNAVPTARTPVGDVFVPARSALGAAVIFRHR